MKSVRVLRNIGDNDKKRLGIEATLRLAEGQVANIDDEIALTLIKQGKAHEMSSEDERKYQAQLEADAFAQEAAALEMAERRVAADIAEAEMRERIIARLQKTAEPACKKIGPAK